MRLAKITVVAIVFAVAFEAFAQQEMMASLPVVIPIRRCCIALDRPNLRIHAPLAAEQGLQLIRRDRLSDSLSS